MKHKIYCFVERQDADGEVYCVAVSDDGHLLAAHISSNESWLPHDLGITSSWKHAHYDAHFGAGNWELEHVRNPDSHPGVKQAMQLATELRRPVV